MQTDDDSRAFVPPKRLERVKAALDKVMQLRTADRSDYVRGLCKDEPPIGQEIRSLLAYDEVEAQWPEGPLLPGASLDRETMTALRVGQRIGVYRVECLLGHGGMGTVAEAIRLDDFRKRVALKVVHDRLSDDYLRRFSVERQVLAQLEHPNIARILDGGEDRDGRPYFVMELVEGEPIDTYCVSHRLGLRQRLDLVLDVCSALELAHRNLVVHRDLKPSNILVTEDGVPKLLDFGIAKRLGEAHTQLTRFRQQPMTLRFASPEQIEGGTITTATDVYGLGVLLYLLFTGHHPFGERKSDLELAEAIRDQEPLAPSRVVKDTHTRQELEGDLDAIVRKALRKKPELRYGSVEALAHDLQSYLKGRPVTARQGTWLYLGSRFVQRHRLPLAAAALMVVASLAFATGANFLRREAESARLGAELATVSAERARLQAKDDQQLKQRTLEFLKEILRGATPNATQGASQTAMSLLREAEARLDRERPLVQAELLATIGEVYRNWGRLDEAAIAWTRAEKLLRQTFPEGHPQLAKAINNVAALHFELEDYEAAVRGYREALAMKQSFLEEQEPVDVAKASSNLAVALMKLGQMATVEELHLEALGLRLAEANPNWLDIGQSLRSLGVFYHETGRLDESEEVMRQAIDAFREAHGGKDNTRVATAINGLGRLLHDQGRLAEAGHLYEHAFELRETLLGTQHPHVVSSRLDLARWRLDDGKVEEADSQLSKVEAWLQTRPSYRYSVFRSRAASLRGTWLAASERWEEAETALRQGCELARGDGNLDLHGRRAQARLDLFLESRVDRGSG